MYLRCNVSTARHEGVSDVLLRLRDLASVGELTGVVKSESLQMRESSERLLSFDGGSEREGEFNELGKHDAFQLDSGGAPGCRRRSADQY